MPIRVQVPGHGIVEFPDGTDQGVMKSALLKLTGGVNAPTEVDAREPGMQGTYERGQRTSGGDPWWGGFLTEIDDMMRRGSISTLESMAHPQTLGDFMSLILPSIGAGQGRSITAGAINELPKRSFQALAEAGTEAKGMGGALKVPFKAIGKFKDKLPSGNQGGEFGGSPRATLRETPAPMMEPQIEVDQFMPNQSGIEAAPPVASVGGTERVPYGGPKNSATQQTGTLTGNKAPTVEQSIQSILEEAMAPTDSRLTSMAPEATTAGEGALKQSGKFGKSMSEGAPGGYSSGRPSITEEQYDDLTQRMGQGRPAPEIPNAATADVTPPTPIENAPVSQSIEEQLLTELNPGGMAQQAQDLRAKVGARDAAGQMFGSGSKENQAAIRTMAPGPSRVPTDAVERIERAGRPRGINDDILKQIIAALGVGGAGAASQQDY